MKNVCQKNTVFHHLNIAVYTTYDGFNLANQQSRHLGVFDQKFEDTLSFAAILIDIRENEKVMFKLCFFIDVN